MSKDARTDSQDVKSITILLVEDNPGDIRLTQEALKESKIKNTLNVARDGDEALAFLRQEEPYAHQPRPDLILLDLNLPKKNGREVLKEIKEDPVLKKIPVIILTTSDTEEDILKSYEHHANCYITKPLDFHQLMEVIQKIENFWLTIVKLPKE